MKRIIILIIFLSVIACDSGNNSLSESSNGKIFKVNEYLYSTGKPLNPNNWDCLTIQRDILCLPNEWQKVNTEEFQYFGYLNNNDSNSFFVSIKYSIKDNQLTMKGYLNEVYRQLNVDTTEKFIEYKLNRLKYENNEAYYAEFFTEIDGKNYETLSMYFMEGEFIFDFSLKCPINQKDKYYKLFQDILFNYQHNGKPLFDPKKELQEVSFLSFDELK